MRVFSLHQIVLVCKTFNSKHEKNHGEQKIIKTNDSMSFLLQFITAVILAENYKNSKSIEYLTIKCLTWVVAFVVHFLPHLKTLYVFLANPKKWY